MVSALVEEQHLTCCCRPMRAAVRMYPDRYPTDQPQPAKETL